MKKQDRCYSFLAVFMVLCIMGGLLCIEQVEKINLLGASFFCFSCSAVLLFCFMKLEVMEFQENSFWYHVNRNLNQQTKQALCGTNTMAQHRPGRIFIQRFMHDSSSYKNIA